MPINRPPADRIAKNIPNLPSLFINQAEDTPDNKENSYNEFGVFKPENYQYARYNSNDSHGSVAQRDRLFGHYE
jgi:hypothetical protein